MKKLIFLSLCVLAMLLTGCETTEQTAAQPIEQSTELTTPEPTMTYTESLDSQHSHIIEQDVKYTIEEYFTAEFSICLFGEVKEEISYSEVISEDLFINGPFPFTYDVAYVNAGINEDGEEIDIMCRILLKVPLEGIDKEQAEQLAELGFVTHEDEVFSKLESYSFTIGE